MSLVYYATSPGRGRYYDSDAETIAIHPTHAERFKKLYRQFKGDDAAEFLDVFKTYCMVDSPIISDDPNASHAQRHRQAAYIRLTNDIELGRLLSDKNAKNVIVRKEDKNERDDYGSRGAVPFTPGE